MKKSAPSQIKNNSSNNAAGRSMLVRWFPQWIGWYSPSATDTQQTETTQLEGEILQALSDTADNNTILKRDAVFGQFNFSLKSGTVNLCTVKEASNERYYLCELFVMFLINFCCSAPMLELQFKNLSLNVVSKPRTSSHLVELSLGALYLRDKMNLNSLFPVLVGPPGQERTSVGRNRGLSPRVGVTILNNRFDENVDQLFCLTYEKKSPKSNFDYR